MHTRGEVVQIGLISTRDDVHSVHHIPVQRRIILRCESAFAIASRDEYEDVLRISKRADGFEWDARCEMWLDMEWGGIEIRRGEKCSWIIA